MPEGGPAADAGDAGEPGPGSGGAGSGRRRGLVGDLWANLGTFLTWAGRTPGVILFIILVNIPAISGKIMESYFSVYMNEAALIAPAALGVLFALSGVVAVPANLLGGRLADRVGRKVAGSAAWLLSGLWLFALTLVSGYQAFTVLFLLDGLIHGGLFPSVDAWSADLCPSRHRGTFVGVLRLVGVLLAVPAPAVGACLWNGVGAAAPLWAAAGINVVTALLLFRFAPTAAAEDIPARGRTPHGPAAAARADA